MTGGLAQFNNEGIPFKALHGHKRPWNHRDGCVAWLDILCIHKHIHSAITSLVLLSLCARNVYHDRRPTRTRRHRRHG